MDPRHPQHPFSRSNASPYSHAPFQPSPNQAPFPPASHAPSGPSPYPEQQRRPSDNPYYAVPTGYARDAAPMPTSNHVRHRSTSSVGQGQGTPIPRNMPPPSSPQQQQHQHAQHQHSHSNPYPPAMNRGQVPPLGPPTYQGGRDLPSLSSINRPGSVNSSMSISSMLGGPPPVSRESAPPQSQYPPPPTMIPASGPPPYAQPVQPSPRMSASAAPDFNRGFRRPHTPEQHRNHEPPVVRDHRSNSAGSPPRGLLSTPESHRYGTPQTNAARYSGGPSGSVPEERRDAYPTRVPNPNAMPPRPSSQPVSYPGPPPGRDPPRMTGEPGRQEPPYNRQGAYSERDDVYVMRERQRLEEEALSRERQDRERRDRVAYSASTIPGHEGPPYGRQYSQQPYADPRDPRDPATWSRRPDAHSEQPMSQQQAPAGANNGFEYARPPGQSYTNRPVEQYTPQENRYPAATYGQSMPPQQAQVPGPQFGSPQQDRRHQPQPVMYREGLQAMAMTGGGYRPHESPRRTTEEIHQPPHRGYLGVQSEINRKGRNSPLPQAVQGAQGQINGPGSEPGIKNEFGKMFSGIGSGVGSMAPQAGTPNGSQAAFPNAGPLRQDLENVVSQDVANEVGPKRAASRGGSGSRRRKLKDEDKAEGDDSSAGRRTPSGRKRAKTTANTSGIARQPATHKYDITPPPEPIQPSNAAADRISAASKPTPAIHNHTHAHAPHSHEHKAIVPHHHHINRHHHHHHHVVPPPKPAYVPIPKPKQIVRSQAVIHSVSDLPRKHLGHMTYEPTIIPEDTSSLTHPSRRGYRSKSAPLPRFEGRENCTFTIRIPRVHLEDTSREEITSSRAVWGTDVYSDDSDIIAAAIHSGWIRGAWPSEVDISLLELEIEPRQNSLNTANIEDLTLTEPPLLGPTSPLPSHDLHITILVLPALERYASTVRHGIKSREFGAPGMSAHDGLSFMIFSMKWVKGVDTTKEAFGEARRSRVKLALNPVEDREEQERDEAIGTALNSQKNYRAVASSEDVFTKRVSNDSFLRSQPQSVSNLISTHAATPTGEKSQMEISAAYLLCGLGAGGWWTGRPEFEVRSEHNVAMDPNGTAGAFPERGVERIREGFQQHSRSISTGLEGLSEAAEAAEAAGAMEEMVSGGGSGLVGGTRGVGLIVS